MSEGAQGGPVHIASAWMAKWTLCQSNGTVAAHEFAYSFGRLDCISAVSTVIPRCDTNGTSILYAKDQIKL